jgi:hypothetical protein
VRHGGTPGVDLPVFLGPDPELALVYMPMSLYVQAFPCRCHGVCECFGPADPDPDDELVELEAPEWLWELAGVSE